MNTNLLQRGNIPAQNGQYNNNISALNYNFFRNNNLNQNSSLANMQKTNSAYKTLTYNNKLNSVNNFQNTKYQSNTFKKKVTIKNGKKLNSGSLIKSSRTNTYNKVIRYGKKIRNIDINLDPEDALNEDTESITSYNKAKSTLLQSKISSTGVNPGYSGALQHANQQKEELNPFSRFFNYLFFNESETQIVNQKEEIPLDTDEILS